MQQLKILEKLNEYQKKAVLDESMACIVNANVGSGKTTVLISKIIYLHEVKRVPYEDMVVLTFTNKAAGEIKERLSANNNTLTEEELMGFGTFHSTCLSMLKHKLPVESLGYTNEFVVIDPDEEIDIANQIIGEEKLVIKYKNRLKKRLEKASGIIDEEKKVSKYNDDIFKLVSLLKEEKIKQNKMTFDDLISNTISLLDYLKEKPKWIIVDEVQDSDDAQVLFMDELKGEDTKLFFVGDPNQVIYSWRGSNITAMYALKHKYNATMLSLPINYRSSKAILDAAKCFQENGNALITNRESGEKIVVKNHYDTFNEACYLVDQIRKLHEEGIPYHEIAIFYRLQEQSKVFEEVFKKNEIPYEVSLKKTIRDIPVLNWIIKVLRYSINGDDITSGVHALSDKQYGEHFTEKEALKIIRGTSKKQSMLFLKMREFRVVAASLKDAKELFDYFDLNLYIRPTSASYTEDYDLIENIFEMIFAQSDLPLIESVNDLVNSSALNGMKLMNREIDKNKDSVKLMTLHASKGLEFSYVYITGVNYGLIPLQPKSYEDEEEERRLFFVGMTRAKDHLELSYYTNPGSYQAAPGESRYIKMIPKQLLQDANDTKETVSLKELKRQIVEAKKETELEIKAELDMKAEHIAEEQVEETVPVQKVRHAKYGTGHVVSEDEIMIQVEFEDYGMKEFMKAFSELEYL